MNIGTINIRGLSAVVKRKKIRNLISIEKLEFIAVQETKLDRMACQGIWGNVDFDWSFSPSIGRSGGLLSIWDSHSMTCLFSFNGYGFMGSCFEKEDLQLKCFVVNIYSPCDLNGKKEALE